MKRWLILMIVFFFLIVFFSKSFFPLKGEPDCSLDNPCPISCGEEIERVGTTLDYFNLSIDGTYKDVLVKVDSVGFTDYMLIIKWEPSVIPSYQNYDCKEWTDCGGSTSCCENYPQNGNYILMVNFTDNPSCNDPTGMHYNISVFCGDLCPDEWCKPYEQNLCCVCTDFRPQMGGCNYYDYCVNGTAANDSSIPCCEDKVTRTPFPCCILNENPSDCSDPNATRNESVIAKYEYCAPISDYDITDVCIDASFANHTWLTC